MDENIPKKVTEFAASHGLGQLEFVGIADGKQVYGEIAEVDEDGFAIPTGLPSLILWDGETATFVDVNDSLRVLSSLD